VALCIMRSNKQSDQAVQTAVEVSDMEGMSAATWEKEGYTYLLIGGRDAHLIRDTAEQLAIRL